MHHFTGCIECVFLIMCILRISYIINLNTILKRKLHFTIYLITPPWVERKALESDTEPSEVIALDNHYRCIVKSYDKSADWHCHYSSDWYFRFTVHLLAARVSNLQRLSGRINIFIPVGQFVCPSIFFFILFLSVYHYDFWYGYHVWLPHCLQLL